MFLSIGGTLGESDLFLNGINKGITWKFNGIELNNIENGKFELKGLQLSKNLFSDWNF